MTETAQKRAQFLKAWVPVREVLVRFGRVQYGGGYRSSVLSLLTFDGECPADEAGRFELIVAAVSETIELLLEHSSSKDERADPINVWAALTGIRRPTSIPDAGLSKVPKRASKVSVSKILLAFEYENKVGFSENALKFSMWLNNSKDNKIASIPRIEELGHMLLMALYGKGVLVEGATFDLTTITNQLQLKAERSSRNTAKKRNKTLATMEVLSENLRGVHEARSVSDALSKATGFLRLKPENAPCERQSTIRAIVGQLLVYERYRDINGEFFYSAVLDAHDQTGNRTPFLLAHVMPGIEQLWKLQPPRLSYTFCSSNEVELLIESLKDGEIVAGQDIVNPHAGSRFDEVISQAIIL
jgi:hypothetical protein